MVWHLEGIIGALAAQAQGAMQVHCVEQAAAVPWWKSLLATVVQTVVSLLSIAAGVGIAAWSFRKNRETEHEQWERDQKKAEWRELLEAVKAAQDSLPIVARMTEESSPATKEMIEKVRHAQQVFFNRLFIDRSIIAPLMGSWVAVSEKAKSAISDGLLDYTVAYLALVDSIIIAARKDLGMVEVESAPPKS